MAKKTTPKGLLSIIIPCILGLLLTIVIVLAVYLPIEKIITNSTTALITGEFIKRVNLLLSNLSFLSSGFLLEQDKISLSLLAEQFSYIHGINLVIITGINQFDSEKSSGLKEYIWAVSGYRKLQNRTEDKTEGTYEQGKSILHDSLSPQIEAFADKINSQAINEISGTVKELQALYNESLKLIRGNDKNKNIRIKEIGIAAKELETQINKSLNNISANILNTNPEKTNSLPNFNPENIKEEYLFYMPIIYRDNKPDKYFKGMIRIYISTEDIMEQLKSSHETFINSIKHFLLIAIILGTAGFMLIFLIKK